MDAAARAAVKRAKAAGEAEMEITDVLSAMAQTLIKKGAYTYHVPVVADPPVKVYAEDKKPPREIFYRQTVTFATKLPPPVLPKRCTCQYLCTGAPARIKCLSCVMYDPKGVGFFCQLCFDARHPWYRVSHHFIDIEKDESIAHTIKVGHRRAEMIRFERDGVDLLERVRQLGPKLDYVADDFQVEHNLKTSGHMAEDLEAKIHRLRREIRGDCRRKGLTGLPLSADEASVLLGRFWRGWRVRRNFSILMLARLRRVGSTKATGGGSSGKTRVSFIDIRDGRTSACKPRMLLQSHVKYVQAHDEAGGEGGALADGSSRN